MTSSNTSSQESWHLEELLEESLKDNDSRTLVSSVVEELVRLDDSNILKGSTSGGSTFTVENSAEYIGFQSENISAITTEEKSASTSTSSVLIVPKPVELVFTEDVEHEIIYISDDEDTEVLSQMARQASVCIKKNITTATQSKISSDKVVFIDLVTPEGSPSYKNETPQRYLSNENENDSIVLDILQHSILDKVCDDIHQDSVLNDQKGTTDEQMEQNPSPGCSGV